MSILLEPLDIRCRFDTAIAPMTVSGTETGPGIALPDSDGPVHAIVQAGDYDEESTLAVTFQESADASTWTTVSGGNVPDLSPGALVLHKFQRTKKYIRCQVAVTGDDTDALLAVLVGQGYKVF